MKEFSNIGNGKNCPGFEPQPGHQETKNLRLGRRFFVIFANPKILQ